MKLIEIKNIGAFTKNLLKLKNNMSLGDVKEALRNSPASKQIDQELAKILAFASSYRRHRAELSGKALSCMFELGQGQKMDVVFKMNHGQVVVTSVQAVEPEPEKEPNVTK